MEYKLFDQPHSHDEVFYKDRELADHIHQADHRPRLLKAVEEVVSIAKWDDTIADFGCGNGGLLRELKDKLPNMMWGFDLQPSNVEDAHAKGSTNVILHDFINGRVLYPRIAVATEVIEHLVDPHGFITKLMDKGVKHIVATTPAYETETFHAPFHLWVWTEQSFKEMFEKCGWVVDKWYIHHNHQFVIAHI